MTAARINAVPASAPMNPFQSKTISVVPAMANGPKPSPVPSTAMLATRRMTETKPRWP